LEALPLTETGYFIGKGFHHGYSGAGAFTETVTFRLWHDAERMPKPHTRSFNVIQDVEIICDSMGNEHPQKWVSV